MCGFGIYCSGKTLVRHFKQKTTLFLWLKRLRGFSMNSIYPKPDFKDYYTMMCELTVGRLGNRVHLHGQCMLSKAGGCFWSLTCRIIVWFWIICGRFFCLWLCFLFVYLFFKLLLYPPQEGTKIPVLESNSQLVKVAEILFVHNVVYALLYQLLHIQQVFILREIGLLATGVKIYQEASSWKQSMCAATFSWNWLGNAMTTLPVSLQVT